MGAEILSGLLAANIAASAVILVVILIRKQVRQAIGARLAYWLWLVPVLAGLATLLPARDAGTVPAPAAPIQPIAEATVEFATAWTAPQIAPVRPGFDLALLIAIVWAAGVLAFLGLMLLQQKRALRTIRLVPGETKSAGNFGPAVVGVLKPLLVVPADFERRFSPSEQSLVLEHERVHLEAGHTRINAALVLLTSINWFNPLVHIAAKLARDDQELSCDAAVLERFPRERGAYAEALLKTQISAQPLPLGCTWPSRSSRFFKERMVMLANKTPSRARRMAGAGFVALALLGAGFAAWAQKPPVPAFVGAKVNVNKEGAVAWEGKAVDPAALAAQAKTQAASTAPNVQLSADAATPYDKVGKVVQAAQKAGMKAIKFMPSGTVLETPTPPPPGLPPPGTRPPPPPPPVSQLAIIEKAKPDPQGTPKSTAPTINPPPYPFPEPLRVFVDFDNGLYLDGKPLDIAALGKAFKENAALKAQPEIHIEPHYLSTYGRVEEVLALADKSGLRRIGVIGGTL
jgi:beta-lactamase regulating signal transducer with metallopeptidase domain/biopolymer transport protein ExbD